MTRTFAHMVVLMVATVALILVTVLGLALFLTLDSSRNARVSGLTHTVTQEEALEAGIYGQLAEQTTNAELAPQEVACAPWFGEGKYRCRVLFLLEEWYLSVKVAPDSTWTVESGRVRVRP